MIIVSGIQPSGRLHVGNYLGAVKNWLTLQEDVNNRCFFFIADWHSLTEQYDPKEKAAQVRELAAELLALELDPDRVTFFRQSDLPEHLELAWYFACVTPVAELQRMTQYKDKQSHGESPNVGLFTYPVLQSADVLLYADGPKRTIGVPVGQDQVQHVELIRDIARWFNNRFDATFPEAKPLLTESVRVMSLKDPTRKMSKSSGADHCLFLDDSPKDIARKLKSAVTDTKPLRLATRPSTQNDNGMSPGVRTLFEILAAYSDASTLASFQQAHENGTIKYSELKPAVAETFTAAHATFRDRKAELMAHPKHIDALLAQGAKAARAVARGTLDAIRVAVGMR